MKRGRGWLAAALAALAVAGATAATRLGPAVPPTGTTGEAVSSTWLCPHGGGPDWNATIEIANPGDAPVQARLMSSSAAGAKDLGRVDVPAHGEVLRQAPARSRGASTRVDIFGGWAAVGWTISSRGSTSGLGAEPCTSEPGPSWFVVDAATDRRTHPFLVVMNPFTSDAVIDVALFLSQRPPVRSDAWTDLPLDAGTSVALDLAAKKSGALGEEIIGTEVTATVGRIAAASLSIRQGGGIRSVMATPALSDGWILPTAAGDGTGVLSLLVPTETPIRYSTAQLSDEHGSRPQGTTDVRQAGTSAVWAQLGTGDASAVVVRVGEGGPVAADLRTAGRRNDEAATGGAAMPADAWVVLPTAFGLDPRPSLVLVNSGDADVSATLTLLHQGGGGVGDALRVSVPARATLGVPGKFLRSDHTAAVLVVADGPVAALGAGRAGSGDVARYAAALGVPVPVTALPANR